MRFHSKSELLGAIETEHAAFVALAASIPQSLYQQSGVWGNGWTVKDLFAHLTEWEQMFLRWYREGLAGTDPSLPASGYTWRQTPELNRAIWEMHRNKELSQVLRDFACSYLEVLGLVQRLPETDIFSPGRFKWVRNNSLATYLVPNTSSHYRTAKRILARWVRSQKRQEKRNHGGA